MGRYLGHWVPPGFWNFIPEQVQNPEKLVKLLEKSTLSHWQFQRHKSLQSSGAQPIPTKTCYVLFKEERRKTSWLRQELSVKKARCFLFSSDLYSGAYSVHVTSSSGDLLKSSSSVHFTISSKIPGYFSLFWWEYGRFQILSSKTVGDNLESLLVLSLRGSRHSHPSQQQCRPHF